MYLALLFAGGVATGVTMKPMIVGTFRAAGLAINPRLSASQKQDRDRITSNKALRLAARQADEVSPSLASELRGMCGREVH